MTILGGILRLQTVTPIPEKRRLAGMVTVNGISAAKRVVVHSREAIAYIGSTVSNSDGSWEIKGMPVMPERSLVVEVIDDSGSFDPIVFDNISQVA